MNGCDGTGQCLIQNGDYTYSTDPMCVHKCAPIACANFPICGEMRPRCFMKTGSLCTNCDIIYGTWTKKGRGELMSNVRAECPVCFESDRQMVQNPWCLPTTMHLVCVECFRQIYDYELANKTSMPCFPGTKDEEESYYDDIYAEQFQTQLFREFADAYEEWERRADDWSPSCPICRSNRG